MNDTVASDPDIYRAAQLIIDQHGTNAGDFAARRADVLIEEGDADGAVGMASDPGSYRGASEAAPG